MVDNDLLDRFKLVFDWCNQPIQFLIHKQHFRFAMIQNKNVIIRFQPRIQRHHHPSHLKYTVKPFQHFQHVRRELRHAIPLCGCRAHATHWRASALVRQATCMSPSVRNKSSPACPRTERQRGLKNGSEQAVRSFSHPPQAYILENS